MHLPIHRNREGNENPLPYSFLENPTDRGAWWATIHGVARVRHNVATKGGERETQKDTKIINLRYVFFCN